jgi:hypothetical protein
MRHRLRHRYGHAAARGLKAMPAPGTRLTGYFLKSTGQQRGREGSRVFTVMGGTDPFVYVDQPISAQEQLEGWGDLPEEQRPKWRSINKYNLEIVGAKPKAEDYP